MVSDVIMKADSYEAKVNRKVELTGLTQEQAELLKQAAGDDSIMGAGTEADK